MSERRLSEAKRKLFKSIKEQQSEAVAETLVNKRRQEIIKKEQDAMFQGVPDSMVITIHDNAIISRDRRRIPRANGTRTKQKKVGFDRLCG